MYRRAALAKRARTRYAHFLRVVQRKSATLPARIKHVFRVHAATVARARSERGDTRVLQVGIHN